MYDILTKLGKAELKKGYFSGVLQKMTGSLSPRPESLISRILLRLFFIKKCLFLIVDF